MYRPMKIAPTTGAAKLVSSSAVTKAIGSATTDWIGRVNRWVSSAISTPSRITISPPQMAKIDQERLTANLPSSSRPAEGRTGVPIGSGRRRRGRPRAGHDRDQAGGGVEDELGGVVGGQATLRVHRRHLRGDRVEGAPEVRFDRFRPVEPGGEVEAGDRAGPVHGNPPARPIEMLE